MKKFILLFMILIPAFCFSQNTNQQVIASGGDEFKTSTAGLSWTLGEVVTSSLSTESHTLSQGFQQGNLTISTIIEEDVPEIALKAYPNPVKDILIIETAELNLKYLLINVNGEIMINGIITSDHEEIDFTGFPAGIYFLSINQKKTHKIVKQ